jgi:putative ABC transport system substrate-binding protein
VQIIEVSIRDSIEIVRGLDTFAADPNGGMIVLPTTTNSGNRDTIIRMAVQQRLPAIYSTRTSTAAGGLMSYGPDTKDQYRRAAFYVDRLLRGTKVADLPVQFPTKYQLAVNMRTAKEIRLAIPEAFLLHADELLE